MITARYEIRENREFDPIRPFQIIDLEDGRALSRRCASFEEAQDTIDGLLEMFAGAAAFSAAIWGTNPENDVPLKDEPGEPVQRARDDEIIIGAKNDLGSIIEYGGERWLVSWCEEEAEVTPANI